MASNGLKLHFFKEKNLIKLTKSDKNRFKNDKNGKCRLNLSKYCGIFLEDTYLRELNINS